MNIQDLIAEKSVADRVDGSLGMRSCDSALVQELATADVDQHTSSTILKYFQLFKFLIFFHVFKDQGKGET